ncbi:19110_t:CDS:2, partial [Funneliformis geosporum]
MSSTNSLEIKQSLKRSRNFDTNNRSTSFAKQFFEIYLVPENEEEPVSKRAKCLFEGCKTDYIWLRSTSNMIGHLRSSHYIIKSTKTAKEIFNKSKSEHLPEPLNHVQQSYLTQQLIRFILSGTLPLSIVNNEEFKIFCNSLDPRFRVPGVNIIKTMIFDAHNWTNNLIKNKIAETAEHVALALDIWSSRVHDAYLGLTCHWLTSEFKLYDIMLDMIDFPESHTATEILIKIQSELVKFGISKENIVGITTDNGSNIKAAITQLEISNISCSAHTLQLSVNLGLSHISSIIAKAKKLINFLSSDKKRRQLKEMQKQLNPDIKELLDVIKDVETRWNSTFHAIQRLIILQPSIKHLRSSFLNNTASDIRKEATEILGGSKYSTLDVTIPAIRELEYHLKSIGKSPLNIGLYGSFLDPRFKKLLFITNNELKHQIIDDLRKQYTQLLESSSFPISTVQVNSDNNSKMQSFFCSFIEDNEQNEFD